MNTTLITNGTEITLPLLRGKQAVVAALAECIVLQPNAMLPLRNIEIGRVFFVTRR